MLTEQQKVILTYLAEGETRVEIAAALGISLKTIKAHLRDIANRLNSKTTAHSISIAITYGHIQPEV